MKRVPLITLSILATVLSHLSCGEKAATTTQMSESSPKSAPSLNPWKPAPGLDGGSLKSIVWKGNDLHAIGQSDNPGNPIDSGIFHWKGDSEGFEILSDNQDLYVENSSSPPSTSPMTSFIYHPPTDTFFVIVDGVLFRKEGDRWARTGKEGLWISLLEADGVLYLRDKGVIETSMDGENWSALTSIESEQDGSPCCYGPLSFDPFHHKLYVYNTHGVFSYDLAQKIWHPMNDGDDLNNGPQGWSIQVVAVDPSSGTIYAGTVFDLYVSKDGTTWSGPLFYQATNAWQARNVRSVTFDPSLHRVYVATGDGVYTQENEGPWNQLSGIDGLVNDVFFKDGTLWAASSTGLWSYSPSDGWVHHSSNGLSTKAVIALELRDGILYAQSDELFPVTVSGDVLTYLYGVYKQVSAGVWELEKNQAPLPKSPASYDPTLQRLVVAKISVEPSGLDFVATSKGVFYSADKRGWQPWNDGLPTLLITSFVYDPTDKVLYAGTTGHGIWRLEVGP